MTIRIKRAYDSPAKEDGPRFLVDRLWPRGVKKEALPMAGWCKELAPSQELRRWFTHDPAKWAEFQRRYRSELDARPEAWEPLLQAAREASITLLYSAHDEEHNNAVVLRDYLEDHLKGGKSPRRHTKAVA